MFNKDNLSFVKLLPEEMKSKMHVLETTKGSVVVWDKHAPVNNVRILSASFVEDDSKALWAQVTLTCDKLHSEFLNKEYVVKFIVRNVQFFFKGQVTLVDLEEKTFSIKAISDVYKLEKRKYERLLTFPHHRVYAFFEMEDRPEDDSLVFLNRLSKDNTLAVRNFIQKNEKGAGSGMSLVGFRALDVSAKGISFLTNKIEADFFQIGTSFAKIKVEFNGSSYQIGKGKVIYAVDYINPLAIKIPMYKIGMNFSKPNVDLLKEVQILIGKELAMIDIQNEFEEFLNGKK